MSQVPATQQGYAVLRPAVRAGRCRRRRGTRRPARRQGSAGASAAPGCLRGAPRSGRLSRGRSARTRPARRLAHLSRSSPSVFVAIAQRVCGTTRMRSTPSRCTPTTSASSAAAVTRPPGLRKILASPALQSEHAQRIDARIHAGHDGDAGVGHAVEPAEVERLREDPVGGEQVVERVAHGSGSMGVQPATRPGRGAPGGGSCPTATSGPRR